MLSSSEQHERPILKTLLAVNPQVLDTKKQIRGERRKEKEFKKNRCNGKKHKERGPKEKRHQTGDLKQGSHEGGPEENLKGEVKNSLHKMKGVRGGTQGERTQEKETQ